MTIRTNAAFKACASLQTRNKIVPSTADTVLANAGIDVSDFALCHLQFMPIGALRESIHIVRTTGRKLGFDVHVDIEQILTRAVEFGLNLCPEELGAEVWHQQPALIAQNDNIILGMEPVIGPHGEKRVWCLGCTLKERWLSIPVCVHWHPEQTWFFCLD